MPAGITPVIGIPSHLLSYTRPVVRTQIRCSSSSASPQLRIRFGPSRKYLKDKARRLQKQIAKGEGLSITGHTALGPASAVSEEKSKLDKKIARLISQRLQNQGHNVRSKNDFAVDEAVQKQDFDRGLATESLVERLREERETENIGEENEAAARREDEVLDLILDQQNAARKAATDNMASALERIKSLMLKIQQPDEREESLASATQNSDVLTMEHERDYFTLEGMDSNEEAHNTNGGLTKSTFSLRKARSIGTRAQIHGLNLIKSKDDLYGSEESTPRLAFRHLFAESRYGRIARRKGQRTRRLAWLQARGPTYSSRKRKAAMSRALTARAVAGVSSSDLEQQAPSRIHYRPKDTRRPLLQFRPFGEPIRASELHKAVAQRKAAITRRAKDLVKASSEPLENPRLQASRDIAIASVGTSIDPAKIRLSLVQDDAIRHYRRQGGSISLDELPSDAAFDLGFDARHKVGGLNEPSSADTARVNAEEESELTAKPVRALNKALDSIIQLRLASSDRDQSRQNDHLDTVLERVHGILEKHDSEISQKHSKGWIDAIRALREQEKVLKTLRRGSEPDSTPVMAKPWSYEEQQLPLLGQTPLDVRTAAAGEMMLKGKSLSSNQTAADRAKDSSPQAALQSTQRRTLHTARPMLKDEYVGKTKLQRAQNTVDPTKISKTPGTGQAVHPNPKASVMEGSSPIGIRSGPELTHVNEAGAARMVSIVEKATTSRAATAISRVIFSNPSTHGLVASNALKKGDVLSVARIAGIMAAKETPRLIPLCHPLNLSSVNVDLEVFGPSASSSADKAFDDDPVYPGGGRLGGVWIEARCECSGQTGVEMEALTTATVAGLTVYDMCKAVDKGMVIDQAMVVQKSGGKSGDWSIPGWVSLQQWRQDR